MTLWDQPPAVVPTETPQLCSWCTNPTLAAARDACTAERCPFRQHTHGQCWCGSAHDAASLQLLARIQADDL